MTPTLPALLSPLGVSSVAELETLLKALLTEKGFEICLQVYTGIVQERMHAVHASALTIASREVNRKGMVKAERGLYVLAAARLVEGKKADA